MRKISAVLAALILSLLIFPSSLGFAEGTTSPTVVDGNVALCAFLKDYLSTTSASASGQQYPFTLDCDYVATHPDEPLRFPKSIVLSSDENIVFRNINLSLPNLSSTITPRGKLTIESSTLTNGDGCMFLFDGTITSANLEIVSGDFISEARNESTYPFCVVADDGSAEPASFEFLETLLADSSAYVDIDTEELLTSVETKVIDISKDATEEITVHVFTTRKVRVVENGKGENDETDEPDETDDPEEPETPEETDDTSTEATTSVEENPDTSVGESISAYYVLFTTFSVVILTTINRDRIAKILRNR